MNSITQFYVLCDVPNIRGGHGDELDKVPVLREIPYVDKSLHCRIVRAMLLLLLQSRFSRVRLCATHRRQPTRLPRPWDSPSKNTGVGCCFLLQLSAILQEYTKCSMVNMESSVSRDGWGQKRAFRVILELCSKPTLVLLKAFFSSSWIIQLFPSWKYSHPE